MGAALRRRDRVDLIDDDGFDVAEDVARLRREQQIQRLGRRDENVRGAAKDVAAVGGGGIARAYGNTWQREWLALASGYDLDARQGGAEVAIDVDGQGLQRRDV